MAIAIKLPGDRLISLDELVKATAAAVEPDQQTYKIVDHAHPGAVGTFSPRAAAEGVHRMALLDAIDRGELIARSMWTRTPYGELGRIDSDWRGTAARYGLTFEDAAMFCALLAIEVQQLGAAEAPASTTAGSAVVEEISYALLATREALIDAFGAHTGMCSAWFDNLKDKPALKEARKIQGRGGRTNPVEPMFDPVEVLQWLVDPQRRKGRPLGQDKGWEILEKHFPKAYARVSSADPRGSD